MAIRGKGKGTFFEGSWVGIIVNFLSTKTLLRKRRWPLAGFFLGAGCLSSCSPTVNLATPNPVKVDIGVRLDVYQKTPPTKSESEQSSLTVAANRRLRVR